MADWALQQLVAMAGEMTPEEAKAHGDRASDEVKRRPKEAKMDGGFQPKQRIKKKDRMIPQSVERKSTIDAPESIPLMRYFSMVAEEMRYISRYQVTLRKISPKPDLDLTNIEMSFSKVKDSSSLVELRIRGVGTIFSVIFPRCLEDGRIQLEDTETLLLSLTYREDPGDLGLRNTLTAVDKINMIQCSSCKQPILQGKPIHKTAELPLGHWDEIADYLICYSGVRLI